jgi:uncharacterized protein YneF (UPF0154 family)
MSIGGIIGLVIGISVATLLIGAVLGFYISQKYFKKQLEDNPPITRDQIKAMYRQMGRTPSEGQINSIMETMKRQTKK